MKPNIPLKKVKCVVIDKNADIASKKLLKDLNINLIETVEIKSINDSTSTHPDMQFILTDSDTALVCDSALDYYKSRLPHFNLMPINNIKSPYPNDCKLNFTVIGCLCFATPHQKEFVPSKYEIIYINQGYSKCNICILNENSIITSDHGIERASQNFGIKAYYLPDNEILLDGYKNGFWGGCSGLIDKTKLFFNGDIEKLTCYSKLKEILEKEKIEPIYTRNIPLCDIGSIIPVF